uniref:Uncharacterized protein n=1 Tax=Steinernema glaseri TaxID=37863 RepID=A0A1I7ZB79_9BILA
MTPTIPGLFPCTSLLNNMKVTSPHEISHSHEEPAFVPSYKTRECDSARPQSKCHTSKAYFRFLGSVCRWNPKRNHRAVRAYLAIRGVSQRFAEPTHRSAGGKKEGERIGEVEETENSGSVVSDLQRAPINRAALQDDRSSSTEVPSPRVRKHQMDKWRKALSGCYIYDVSSAHVAQKRTMKECDGTFG